MRVSIVELGRTKRKKLTPKTSGQFSHKTGANTPQTGANREKCSVLFSKVVRLARRCYFLTQSVRTIETEKLLGMYHAQFMKL